MALDSHGGLKSEGDKESPTVRFSIRFSRKALGERCFQEPRNPLVLGSLWVVISRKSRHVVKERGRLEQQQKRVIPKLQVYQVLG